MEPQSFITMYIKSPPLCGTLYHLNPINLESILILSSHEHLSLSSGILPTDFSTIPRFVVIIIDDTATSTLLIKHYAMKTYGRVDVLEMSGHLYLKTHFHTTCKISENYGPFFS
jgi:hypothetical protein